MRQNPRLPEFPVHAPLHSGPPATLSREKKKFLSKACQNGPRLHTGDVCIPPGTGVASVLPPSQFTQPLLPARPQVLVLPPQAGRRPTAQWQLRRRLGSWICWGESHSHTLHRAGDSCPWARPVLGLYLGPPNKGPQMGQLQTTEVYSLPVLVAGTKIKLSAGLSSVCRLQGRFLPPLLAFGGPRCPVALAVSLLSLPRLHAASLTSLSNLPRPLSSEGLCLWTKTLSPNKPVVFTGSRWTNHLGATTVPTAVELLHYFRVGDRATHGHETTNGCGA